MRQKEKRRKLRELANQEQLAIKLANKSNPIHPDYIHCNNTECLNCYCEYDSNVNHTCPSCGK